MANEITEIVSQEDVAEIKLIAQELLDFHNETKDISATVWTAEQKERLNGLTKRLEPFTIKG